MNATQEKFIEYQDEYQRKALGDVRRMQAKGVPYIKALEMARNKYKPGMDVDKFKHEIHSWAARLKKGRKSNGNPVKNWSFVFADLYRSIIKDCNFVPDDEVMISIAKYFGLTRGVAATTRSNLEKEGYIFKNVEFGFRVEFLDPEVKEIRRQMESLQKMLEKIEKKYPATR